MIDVRVAALARVGEQFLRPLIALPKVIQQQLDSLSITLHSRLDMRRGDPIRQALLVKGLADLDLITGALMTIVSRVRGRHILDHIPAALRADLNELLASFALLSERSFAAGCTSSTRKSA